MDEQNIEVLSLQFGIAITEPKRCVGPRESKFSFSGWK